MADTSGQDIQAFFQRKASFRSSTSMFFNLAINVTNQVFIGDGNLAQGEFAKMLSLTNCEFQGTLTFTNCQFRGVVSFSEAVFLQKVSFINCIFNQLVKFSNSQISEVSFESCTFERALDFVEVKSNGLASFNNTKFNQAVNLNSAQFSEASFEACAFEGIVESVGVKFDGQTSFNKSKFHRPANFTQSEFTEASFEQSTFAQEISFAQAKFTVETSFNKSVFHQSANFTQAEFAKANLEHCTFENLADFTKATFSQPALFNHSTFAHDVNFNSATTSGLLSFEYCSLGSPATEDDDAPVKVAACTFANAQLGGEVSFKEAECHAKVRFQDTSFAQTANFENTVFHDLADFYKAHFKSAQQFHRTDFLGVTIFSNVIFDKEIQFLYNKVDSTGLISFQRVQFNQALDISRANFLCKLSFFGASFNEYPTQIELYKYNSVTKEESNTEGEEAQKTVEAYQKIRESFRIVKQTFKSEGNNIEVILQNKHEMVVYGQELEASKKLPKDKPLKWYEKIISPRRQNLLIIGLNNLSNRHGTSWVRGVAFTVSVAWLFFMLMLLCFVLLHGIKLQWGVATFGKNIKYYLEFLNLTNWKYAPYKVKDYSWAYLILFIGRLLVGYGVYQTVQAFRKFSKK